MLTSHWFFYFSCTGLVEMKALGFSMFSVLAVLFLEMCTKAAFCGVYGQGRARYLPPLLPCDGTHFSCARTFSRRVGWPFSTRSPWPTGNRKCLRWRRPPQKTARPTRRMGTADTIFVASARWLHLRRISSSACVGRSASKSPSRFSTRH